jgi:hypothetical protein
MEKKKILGILALVVVLSAVLAVTVAADCHDPCPPPEPPPCDYYCSPGFWKNHQFWMEDDNWTDPGMMLAALQARGNDDLRPMREVVTGWLNDYYQIDCDD